MDKAISCEAMVAFSNDTQLYNQPVVLDNGSGVLKAGFTGGSKPSCFEYSVVGNVKYEKVMTNSIEDRSYVGNSAQRLRGLLKLRRPINHGVVENWDDMELLWEHIFNDELQLVKIEEHPLLITEAPLNPVKNREIMCEILYEKFGLSALYIANPAVLSLYASGKTTGCVLDCGDGYCSSVPIYEGYALPNSTKRIDIAGRDITKQLQLYLRKATGISLFSSNEQEIVRTIKEKVNYVAADYVQEEEKYNVNEEDMTSKFKLPDGQILSIANGKYRTSEILFNPKIMGVEYDSLPEICFQSINKIDLELRPSLYSNIVLSGGTTMLKGFADRMISETQRLTNNNIDIRIISPRERKFTTWIGGSILTGLSTFRNMWLTKKSWEDNPKIIEQRLS